jgi:pantetheine-phosphate adenylyltransferase/8-oxo-dGTP diphosphatase
MQAVPVSERIRYQSPYGVIELRTRAGKLLGARLCRGGGGAASGSRRAPAAAGRFVEALDRYFAGEEPAIEGDALDLAGLTAFQRKVFGELRKVGFGQTVTYGELAARVGSPGGARAVGQALGRNPVPIFVPCHRVVASGGRLGGFGAGLRWKRSLLSHEGWTVREGAIVSQRPDEGKTCVYAGSFDPPTNGHMFMVEKGAELFERLIVSVGINPNKRYTFSLEDRLEMLRRCTEHFDNVAVASFEGQFLVHYAESMGAGYVLRGIRSEEDYRFEHAMRNVNEDLEPGVTTVFLIPPREICEVSSSFVKGLVGFAGWEEVVKPYVPQPVYEQLLVTKIRWTQQSAGAEGGSD